MRRMRFRALLVASVAGWAGCSSADKDEPSGVDSAEDGSDAAGGGADDGGSAGDGGGTGGDDGVGSGDDGSGDDGSVDLGSLNGSVPDNPQELPDFVATHYDGSARAREDLLGHPTVIWFYPAAATGG